MNEIWKDVEGYEGLYQISNYGNVKSIERLAYKQYRGNRKVNSKILKQFKCSGYLCVKLYNKSKCKTVRVHRLVAETFISNKNNYPEVDHIDTNINNNNVNNLRWCTHKSNFLDNKLTFKNIKAKPVICYDLQLNYIQNYNSITEASKKLNLNWGSIKKCCDGDNRHKRVGKYRFKYLEGLYESN